MTAVGRIRHGAHLRAAKPTASGALFPPNSTRWSRPSVSLVLTSKARADPSAWSASPSKIRARGSGYTSQMKKIACSQGDALAVTPVSQTSREASRLLSTCLLACRMRLRSRQRAHGRTLRWKLRAARRCHVAHHLRFQRKPLITPKAACQQKTNGRPSLGECGAI